MLPQPDLLAPNAVSEHGDHLSAAVQRIVNAAQQRAADRLSALLPDDVLQAVLDDEGHATELLRQAGVTASGAAPPDEPLSLPRLLRAAGQLARTGDQTSSLHLLLALSRTDPGVAAHLAAHGLDDERLAAHALGTREVPPPPIPVDVRIAHAAPAVDDLAGTYRILDAAANRAREGLRVLEDHARFTLGDAHLTTRLKDLRHLLAQRLATLCGDRALPYRDTPRDVGTRIHTPFETHRDSARDILRANARRVEEALRTLEEHGKRLDGFTALQLGDLRYQCYTLERALLTATSVRERLQGVDLCLLATDELCPRGSGPVVQAALAAGCPMIQLREKQVPDSRLLSRARLLREWTRAAGALFIVNDRPDLAVLADADGVHLGQEDLSVADARRIVGGDRLIGVSTHNVEQIRQAVLDGADYLGVGPVFPSQTKSFDAFAGLEFVRAAATETSLPWFAIGGIGPDNIAQLLAAGGRRIAVTGAVCAAPDPAEAVRELRQALAQSAAEPEPNP